MEDRGDFMALLAEEYRTLAAGGNQANRHTYTALQWGTAVVGIVVGAAISQWGKHDAVVELVFLFGVPALVAMGMLFWIGELARMSRIADFICVLEAKVELAFQLRGSDPKYSAWFAEFRSAWTAQRKGLLAKLHLTMPADQAAEIAVGSGPIAFEHWLRAIRNTQASSNLIWVFIVRFLLFPAAMLVSWVTGIYYILLQSERGGFGWENSSVAFAGLILGVTTIWFAAELVVDLSNSAPRTKEIALPRREFRRLLGRPFRITEWQSREPLGDTGSRR